MCLCLSLAALTGCAKDEAADPSSSTTEAASVIEESTVNIPETLVYDSGNIKVWFSQPETSREGVAEFSVSVENNSESGITLGVDSMVINKITMPAFLYFEIPKGEKVSKSISFAQEELSEYGIEQFVSVGFPNAALTDGETFTEILKFDIVTEAGKSGAYEQIEQNEGVEIVNENGIQIIAQKFYKDYFGDYYLRLFVKNTSGTDVNVTARNTKINDKGIEGWMHEYVADGTWTLCDIGFYAADVENMKLDVFESVSASFDAKTPDYEIIMESDELEIVVSQIENVQENDEEVAEESKS